MFPEIDNAPAPTIKIPMREGRTDRPPLNDVQRGLLYAVAQHPGWNTVLTVMEDACIQQEVNLINVDSADVERIKAEHAITKAMWLFYTRLQKKILFEVNEMFSQQPGFVRNPEEQEIAEILDATS